MTEDRDLVYRDMDEGSNGFHIGYLTSYHHVVIVIAYG